MTILFLPCSMDEVEIWKSTFTSTMLISKEVKLNNINQIYLMTFLSSEISNRYLSYLQ